MKIIKLLQDRLLGNMTVLTVTASSVKICQGSKSLAYNLPKTFQKYNYLNHAEEMAGWLLAVLREEKIWKIPCSKQILRLRFALQNNLG